MQKYHLYLCSEKKATSQFSKVTLVNCFNFVTDDDDTDDHDFFCVIWLIDEKCLNLFPAAAIVRDPHHRESPARR